MCESYPLSQNCRIKNPPEGIWSLLFICTIDSIEVALRLSSYTWGRLPVGQGWQSSPASASDTCSPPPGSWLASVQPSRTHGVKPCSNTGTKKCLHILEFFSHALSFFILERPLLKISSLTSFLFIRIFNFSLSRPHLQHFYWKCYFPMTRSVRRRSGRSVIIS